MSAAFHVAPCTEFPNDNPGLHGGAIWLCAEIGADASFELPAPLRTDEASIPSRPGAPDTLALEAPAPVPEMGGEDPFHDEPYPEETDGAAFEIVEELSFEDAVDEQPDSSPAQLDASPVEDPASPVSAGDPFASFMLVLEDVATASGADDRARDNLRAYLGGMSVDGVDADARALAWQGILRGESDDFGPCGAVTLDEWAAELVARALGNTARAAGIRRDLRQRGVAAFGFVADAA